MPYEITLTSPKSGRSYTIQSEQAPRSDDDLTEAGEWLDAQATDAEAQKPGFQVGDALNSVVDAVGGLTTTLPAAYYRLTEGFQRPDKYSPSARAAFDEEKVYAKELADENTQRLLTGNASSTGDAFRSVGPSLGFSGATMAAAIVGGQLGKVGGSAIGGVIGTPIAGVGAAPGAAIGNVVGGVGGGMAAAGAAAYRMAGAQFLDDAFQAWLAKNPKADEAAREEAYQQLLPLAQDSALWEAGPEAIGTVVGMGAGKVVLGLGKQTLTSLAKTALGKAGIKAGALAGGVGTELATETATQVGQGLPQAKADAFASGQDMSTATSRYDVPGGTMQAFQDVAPQTLALSGLMLGMGGAGKGLQMVGTQAGRGEEGKRGAGEPGPPPLPVREDLGELTAEDVADLEEATVQDSSTVPARAPILTNVPDRVEPTADAPVLSAAESSGLAGVQDAVRERLKQVEAAPEHTKAALLSAFDRHKLILDGVYNLGVPTVFANSGDAAVNITGDVSLGKASDIAYVHVDATGDAKLIIRTDILGSLQTEDIQSKVLDVLIPHEVFHAAQAAYDKAKPAELNQALQAFDPNSPEFDNELHSFMIQEYTGYETLPARNKLYEAVRAIMEGRYKGTVTGTGLFGKGKFANYLKQFLSYIQRHFSGKGTEFSQYVARIERSIGIDYTSPDARVPATSETSGLAADEAAGETVSGQAAAKGLKNLQSRKRSNAGSTTLPDAAIDALVNMAQSAVRAGKKFTAWLAEMVARFGEAVRGYAVDAWDAAHARLGRTPREWQFGGNKGTMPSAHEGGFRRPVMDELKARFARPEQQERLYQVREDVTVKAAAEAWVDSLPMAEAVAAMEAGRLPADMTGDVAQHAAGLLIQRTTEMMKSGSEVVQMQARSLGHRISKVWQGWLSQEAGRNLRQRSVVNSELTPYAPILAAEGMLIDRADAVMDKRYEGGAEGGATKVNETAAAAGDEAGETLADDLEGETPERKAAKQQVRKQMAPAMKKLSKAQKTADRILQQLSERYADPPLMDANGLRKVDPVRALYKQHVQAPMSEADFVQQMMALGVPEGLAGTLWEASRLEIEARETLRLMAEAERAATKNAREIEVAENRASRLIYRTEERLRQGSKDLSRSTDGDSINKVFRDKVKDDIGWEAFRDRLAKLRVGEDIAARLWRTAERERIDQAAMVRFREERKAGEVRSGILAKGSQKLRQMLNDLRKKIAHDMTWADIFMELPASQKERQREIYRRLMLDERLKGLTKEERLALTNELDKAWQQERRKVFLRELERVGIGEKAPADKAKVVKALPKLIRLINLGMMNSEMFREAIAPEYGLKQITTGQALSLRKLAEEAYALPEGVLRSRKLAELLDGIQKSTGTGLPEVLNQYWVAAVLSGMRTQFDTFMSVTNGFGNQLIQSGMLAIKNGNRAAAMVSMLEWWRGLKQAFPEAMQILSKGDYSYLKRFNDDLRKALEGETTFRPVPLGEALWRDGNAMEKYGFAPVMIWTGRLMAAADHLNNSATTAGAKVVARALHPELYKTVSASQSEREAAAAQARREVTGGAMPATAPERATVAARTREILNGQLRPEEVKEAAFMGDQAAYQNDPTGVFGGIYRAVNQGLGTLERGLQAYAEERGADGPAGRYARGMMLFFSGAMRSMVGAKFIRFGANFGNDMLGYVPGTVLVSPALLGTEATRSQRQLLMGKNVFGLMAGLTVAAMFLGKDDEEEGWHMEGPWSDLTPEEVKQRRAAGFESLTFWKRTADKVERVSYKQWPTAGLLAGVAHMQDRQRFRPEKWAKEGMAGHLLAAATVGAFQVKDVSAMRGLADLLGASKFGANPEDALVEKMAKMPVNFAGGFIPTLVKDLDALADSRRYKPETVMEEFLRNVPLARRAVAGGRPEINILGVAIEQDRKPWSRAYTDAESGPAHAVLGSLSARGFTLPTPETNRKVWKDGAWSTIAAMGADAEWRYQKKVGEGYRAWLGSSEGRALLTMPDGLAVQKLINRQADTIKRQALQAVMK